MPNSAKTQFRERAKSGLGTGPETAAWITAALLLLLLAVPVVATFYKSFLALDPADPSAYGSFVGSDNYLQLLTVEPEFWSSLRASLAFVFLAMLQCVGAAILAIWLRYLWPTQLPRLMLICLITPLLVSPTCLGLMGRLYLHDQVGIVSHFLRAIRLIGQNSAILASVDGATAALAVLDAWQWLPFTALLFWLSFQLVPRQQIEAAKLDAFSGLTTISAIYLPKVWGPALIIILIRLLEAFREFELPQVLTGGGPGTSTLMTSLYANRVTFVQQRFGIGAAHLVLLDVIASVFIFAVIARMKSFRVLLRKRVM
jgi:multiple sugar transport system permease protein